MGRLRTVLEIARRDFVERARSRAFIISNAVLVVALLAGFALPQLFGGDGDRRLGFVGAAASTAQLVERQAPQAGVEVELVELGDAEAARTAVRPPDERSGDAGGVPDEPVDAAVLADGSVVVWEELAPDLERALVFAVQTETVRSALADVELSQQQIESLVTPPDLDVTALQPPEEAQEGPALLFGAVAVFMLYGLLIFYGQFVALGVIEEKSSRVVEVLLSAVRPTSLLLGKVLGLTALGLAQVLLLAAVGLLAAQLFIETEIPPEAYGTIALAGAWFILGFLLYATLFAVAASLVSDQQDLQATMLPVLVPIIGAFFAAQFSLQDPDSTVSLVTGLVPLTAPLVQPLRFGAQVAAPWEVPVAVALCVGTIALLIPLAARFYTGSVLRFGGRVGLGEAWRAGA